MYDLKQKIDEANQEAIERMLNSQPVWEDVRKAGDVCPGLKKNMIMHAGPPVTWERMCFPQKTAVKGAIIYEGWAKTMEEAEHLVASGEVKLSPCHEHNTVGSMCGVTSPSMPVLVIRNEIYGNEGYVLIYESADRQRLMFGCYGDTIQEKLKWIEEVAAPVLKALVTKTGPINFKGIISKGLTAGDELHSRSAASTAIFFLEVAPYFVELEFDRKQLAEVVTHIRSCENFFTQFAMAAGKVTADAADGINYCTIVTAIARNGVEAGIRISGLPGQWFTGPAGVIEGLYFVGNTEQDGEGDLGDSAILETTGLGACAYAASPALALVKGSVEAAFKYTNEMQEICVSSNPNYGIPALGGKGSPLGIDIRKVLDTGIMPIINTGIAHRKGGFIGLGNARVPKEAFKKALLAFRDKYSG